LQNSFLNYLPFFTPPNYIALWNQSATETESKMKWHHCIDSAQKLALELCHGSMNKGDGYGSFGWRGYGKGDGYGCGYGLRDGDGVAGTDDDSGDGDGDGYADGVGDGWSCDEW
jgi:hypothetical protein